ncbi:hypothetical protein AX16_008305 [Volvariella volvacea WC 439]|nr:hypothetical protein AX16_008305 [Volvariella volvacea WC 439]
METFGKGHEGHDYHSSSTYYSGRFGSHSIVGGSGNQLYNHTPQADAYDYPPQPSSRPSWRRSSNRREYQDDVDSRHWRRDSPPARSTPRTSRESPRQRHERHFADLPINDMGQDRVSEQSSYLSTLQPIGPWYILGGIRDLLSTDSGVKVWLPQIVGIVVGMWAITSTWDFQTRNIWNVIFTAPLFGVREPSIHPNTTYLIFALELHVIFRFLLDPTIEQIYDKAWYLSHNSSTNTPRRRMKSTLRLSKLATAWLHIISTPGAAVACLFIQSATLEHHLEGFLNTLSPKDRSTFVTHRLEGAAVYGFCLAFLENIPLLGILFEMSNAIATAKWARDCFSAEVQEQG